MTEKQSSGKFDLEDRTLDFARNIRTFLKKLPKSISNNEDGKQLIRSWGSIGANYIEANEALSKKDFIYRIGICRKEAKESRFWLKLLNVDDQLSLENELGSLIDESTELMRIFGAIIQKSK